MRYIVYPTSIRDKQDRPKLKRSTLFINRANRLGKPFISLNKLPVDLREGDPIEIIGFCFSARKFLKFSGHVRSLEGLECDDLHIHISGKCVFIKAKSSQDLYDKDISEIPEADFLLKGIYYFQFLSDPYKNPKKTGPAIPALGSALGSLGPNL